MPITAITKAIAANVPSNAVRNFGCATESDNRASIVRTSKSGRSGSTAATALRRTPPALAGSKPVRTAMLSVASGRWLQGTNISGSGSRPRSRCRTLPTMPTISRQTCSLDVSLTRWPIGSVFGQYFFAIVSLIKTTRGAPSWSASENSRPRKSGIPMTLTYSGLIERKWAVGMSPFDCSFPSIRMPKDWPPPGKGQLGSQRRLAHSRLAADGFKQSLRKRQTLLSVGVGGKWQRDPRGQQTLRPKSERRALQPREAFDQQPGSGQQHHGQRHLRHHEHRAHPLLAKATHRRAAGFQRLG